MAVSAAGRGPGDAGAGERDRGHPSPATNSLQVVGNRETWGDGEEEKHPNTL